MSSGLSANESEKNQQLALLGLCIKLLEQCLSFDFIGKMQLSIRCNQLGTTFDDSLDGLNLIYVPSSWEEFFSEGQPIQKLFAAYEAYPPPYSTQVDLSHFLLFVLTVKCLQVLELFAATRSSLFTTFETRTAFLNGLINGIGMSEHSSRNAPSLVDPKLGKILVENKDLDNEENRHNMARILLRLKTSFQLKYLQETQNYPGLMEQVTPPPPSYLSFLC